MFPPGFAENFGQPSSLARWRMEVSWGKASGRRPPWQGGGRRGGAKRRQLAGRPSGRRPRGGRGGTPGLPRGAGPQGGPRRVATIRLPPGRGGPAAALPGVGRPCLTSGGGARHSAQPAAGVVHSAPRGGPAPSLPVARPPSGQGAPGSGPSPQSSGWGGGGAVAAPDSRLGDSRKEGGRATVGVGRGGNILSAPGAPQTAQRASRPDGARGQECRARAFGGEEARAQDGALGEP